MPLSPTARGTPAGRRIPEGFKCLVTFKSIPTLGLWEKAIKPPGADGGEPINITTQHNKVYNTMFPRTLIKREESTFSCAYDPDVITNILALINHPDEVTWLYPDGTTEVMYGWLRKFDPKELKEGEFPEAEATVTPMMCVPSTMVEDAGTLTPAAGT